MVDMALAKSLYAIPTWTRTVRLACEHAALAAAIAPDGDVPSVHACYRFTAKLRAPLLDACIAAVLDRLREANPGMGESIAIDGSDLPAYANGQRFTSKNGRERAASEYSDPDASWGTARQSRRARAAVTTATRSTLPYASSPACRSHGPSRCLRMPRRRSPWA
jgi:hypothetical protein